MRRHAILLYTGYIFIGIAVLFSALVLVYQANGFGVNGDGKLVRNGLVFVSSQPNPATIMIDGKQDKAQTNSRLSLASGSYDVRLTRDGYRDWARQINVQGGDVQNFDYPFLVPQNMRAVQTVSYPAAPGFATQSRDRRWMVVQQESNAQTFNVYDLNVDDSLEAEVITLPENIVTATDGAPSWEVIQWANDNEHFLVKHTYGTGSEYIVIDRVSPGESVNLNNLLQVTPSSLALIDNKFDRYHILIDGVLSSAGIDAPELQTIATAVLEFKSYDTDMVMYATPAFGETNLVDINVIDDDRNYVLRQVNKSSKYSLDTANYRGNQYYVIGASNEPQAYIYKNPVQQLRQSSVLKPAADRAIRINGPTHVSFSPNTQFVLTQNGSRFGVYDLFSKRPYVYDIEQPLDAPQQHAEWMDGFHLTYISGGKQIIFDYDKRNVQTLTAALPQQYGYFAQDYRFLYGFEQGQDGVVQFKRTGLRTTADL